MPKAADKDSLDALIDHLEQTRCSTQAMADELSRQLGDMVRMIERLKAQRDASRPDRN